MGRWAGPLEPLEDLGGLAIPGNLEDPRCPGHLESLVTLPILGHPGLLVIPVHLGNPQIPVSLEALGLLGDQLSPETLAFLVLLEILTILEHLERPESLASLQLLELPEPPDNLVPLVALESPVFLEGPEIHHSLGILGLPELLASLEVLDIRILQLAQMLQLTTILHQSQLILKGNRAC